MSQHQKAAGQSDGKLDRKRLADHLRTACELEHSLCCQYLYAAFSLRRSTADFPADTPQEIKSRILSMAQRWAFQILLVAREEMSHLAMAVNMLAAIGEAPHFEHGDYPDAKLAAKLGAPAWLQRCDRECLVRFRWFERPDNTGLPLPKHATVKPNAEPEVIKVYEAILHYFETIPAEDLFEGDGQRQVVDTLSNPDVNLGLSMLILPTSTRTQIVEAIATIFFEGEGQLPPDYPKSREKATERSHFDRFQRMIDEYDELELYLNKKGAMLEPSLPVALNPTRSPGRTKYTTVVDNPLTLQIMELFDDGYQLMLIMLREFFAEFRGYSGPIEVVESLQTTHQLGQRRKVVAMIDNAFYPFMTMFIRPLGELLARQPAHENATDARRAGAAFSLKRPIAEIGDLNYYRRSMEALETKSRRIAAHANGDELTGKALRFLSQNLHRMNKNLIRVWSAGV